MRSVRLDLPDHAAEVRRALVDAHRLCEALGLLEGYTPARQGLGLTIRCPSHGDRRPSCSVTLGPDRTLRVRCFACDFAGDALTLVAAARGLDLRRDFPRVLEEAAELAGLTLDLGGPTPPRAPTPRVRLQPALAAPRRPRVEPETFVRAATALLELCPLSGSVAVGLTGRGLLGEAQRDGWGELPRDVVATSAGAGFDAHDRGAQRLVRELLDRFDAGALGWIVRAGAFVHADHRLLVPWRRPDGQLWSLQRRYAPLYGDEKPEKVGKYLWPPEVLHAPPERFAYGVDAPELRAAEEVWIVEGAVDVLALRALNRAARRPRAMAALGLPGVSAWGSYRESVLAEVRGKRVHVSLDADRAGEAGVEQIARDAWRAGACSVDRPRPVGGHKDWAELSERRLGTGAPRP